MKYVTIDYYLHGLKWREIPTIEDDLKQGFRKFHLCTISDDDDETINYEPSILKEAFFKIANYYQYIKFSDLPYGFRHDIICHGRDGGMSKIKYLGKEIEYINYGRGFLTLVEKLASCDNPHIYVNSKGELAYRDLQGYQEFNLEEKNVKIIKFKKSLFEIIDLE